MRSPGIFLYVRTPIIPKCLNLLAWYFLFERVYSRGDPIRMLRRSDVEILIHFTSKY